MCSSQGASPPPVCTQQCHVGDAVVGDAVVGATVVGAAVVGAAVVGAAVVGAAVVGAAVVGSAVVGAAVVGAAADVSIPDELIRLPDVIRFLIRPIRQEKSVKQNMF